MDGEGGLDWCQLNLLRQQVELTSTPIQQEAASTQHTIQVLKAIQPCPRWDQTRADGRAGPGQKGHTGATTTTATRRLHTQAYAIKCKVLAAAPLGRGLNPHSQPHRTQQAHCSGGLPACTGRHSPHEAWGHHPAGPPATPAVPLSSQSCKAS